ncbi:hypothetical protein KP509_10G054100 [Ceratopteris richardii]|uniref:Uncharacterized protein n=1 Tax=Ceratopteris richardii TaxID=49495 RepID=A0A8T2U1J5_CERRI|nr:hypothetical protein KP509_10G054100 [Ceratopteris richardii]
MASSVSHAAAKLRAAEPTCRFSSTVHTVSVGVPRNGQQCLCRKQILGIAIFPQNASLNDSPLQQQKQQNTRRITIEAAKRVDNMRSFLINSTLKAQEGEIEKVAKLCDDIRVWAREKKKDATVGCKHFDCYVDLYEKNVFHFMEEYMSVLHMNDFRASPEHIRFFEEVRPLLLEPIALSVYEIRDGKISCMLNPIGPKGEGGLDDATGQAGRGGDAYMKPKIQKKRRGIEYEDKIRQFSAQPAEKKAEENQWSLGKVIAQVLGQDTKTADEQWNLKSLFGKKK